MNAFKTSIAGLAAGAAVLALGTSDARAEWPERPITVVVMYGAGGGTDTQARLIAAELEKRKGWKIIPQNMPGKAGGIMARKLKNMPADGLIEARLTLISTCEAPGEGTSISLART